MNDQWAVKDMHPKFTNTGSTNFCVFCESTARKRAVAVKALEFYADEDNHIYTDYGGRKTLPDVGDNTYMQDDCGTKAREALATIQQEKST